MRWLLTNAVDASGRQLNRTTTPAATAPPPAAAGLAATQPPTGDSFDTNMVIILAALLCALILALGLNSILRCALRCSTAATGGAGKVPRGGLKKGALRKLPLATYGGAAGATVAATECPICLGDFEAGDQVRALPGCGHGFHARCVDAWLVSNSSCPTCRRSLLADVGAGAKARVTPAAADPEPRMGYRARGLLVPGVALSPPPPMV